MTTMRSVEPMTGVDAVLSALLPFLNGTAPEAGEHGIDSDGNIYTWQPGHGGWVPERELEAG
jgi:hypothetical protein